MLKLRDIGICVTLSTGVLLGCETTSPQMETTVYDMHRRIVRQEQNLNETVSQLNETTLTLSQQVSDSEQQTRRIVTKQEELQYKLENLESSLESFRNTMYRHFNLSGAGTGGARTLPPPASGGDVTIEPPAGQSAAPAVQDAQPSMVEPTEQPVMEDVADAGSGTPREDYARAQATYANGDYQSALRQFNQFLQNYPNADSEMRANAQFWKAKSLLNENNYREAIQEFDTLSNQHANSTKVPFALHNQAVAYSRIGQNDEAIRLMQTVIDDYPISPAADQARSDILRLQGN